MCDAREQRKNQQQHQHRATRKKGTTIKGVKTILHIIQTNRFVHGIEAEAHIQRC